MYTKFPLFLICLSVIFQMHGFSQKPAIPRVVKETSRAPDLIKKEFPYDIQLKNSDGQIFNSATLFKKNNKATVLLFWMTTCGPCRNELQAISQKYAQWKKQLDFEFYPISIDFSDRTEQFNNLVKGSKWTFPAYFDFNREFRHVMAGELNGLPQLFVLNKKGDVIYHTRKYIPGDEDKLFEFLKSI
ncbi:MAG: TlpA family protein disulfide reductase [Saprospiraceae bacterium]|nr:TlpA family protein disulfide reductase [Saprospiraceae bacterium]